MFLAFVGDSTITSDVPPAGGGSSSSRSASAAAARERALVLVVFLAAAFFATAFLAADFVAELVTLRAAVFVAALDDVLAAFAGDFTVFEADLLAFFTAFLTAVTRVVVSIKSFGMVISSVYLRSVAVGADVVEATVFRNRTDFWQPNTTVDMHQRPLD